MCLIQLNNRMRHLSHKVTQLNPPLRVTTPLGEAICHFIWTWPSMCWWCCFQEETGEPWWWQNHQVRLETNISEGRFKQSPIHESEAMKDALTVHRKRYER